MALVPGTRIGPYEILEPLGAGGMGEVYRARDTKLGRDVAVKVLPATLAEDAGRMARFEREAQLLAALNHPNIAAIHGVEQNALVMELVPGEQLKGPLPVDTAVNYARQIASALEAAHEKGIIHRDLKPANIKVTPDGVVKLLDFGLAKSHEDDAASNTTRTLSMTEAGVILGTAAYMPPEQARGKPVDKRADIWAFGVVLYEMLAGRMLFGGGETASDALAAVITKEPDWTALPSQTPARVRKLLVRCLRKDPKLRLRDIGEARLVLDEPDEAPVAQRRSWVPWAVAAVAAGAALIASATAWFRPKPTETAATRFVIGMPEGSAVDPATLNGPQAVPSPDGRYIAFVLRDNATSRNHLWLRPMGSLATQRIDRTEGANFPFWSPDSKSIGFFADRSLRRIAVSGGALQTVCRIEGPTSNGGGDGAAWTRDDTIVFSSGSSPLMRVSAMGGQPAAITTLDASRGETTHSWPQILPDGRHILYLARSDDLEKSAIYVGGAGVPQRTLLLPTRVRAMFAEPGYLLFPRQGTLFAQRMDVKTLQLEGQPAPIATEVTENEGTGRAAFAASNSGVLVYRGGILFDTRQLSWYDRAGKLLAQAGSPGQYANMSLSPDGRKVALTQASTIGDKADSWIMDLGTGVPKRATLDNYDRRVFRGGEVWSPDSQRIAVAREGELVEIVVASGARRVLSRDPNARYAHDWSPDGNFLLTANGNESRISLLPLVSGGTLRTIAEGPFRHLQARISPDGGWLAYVSDETGEQELYVASLPSFAQKQPVSKGGAVYPVWRRDGKELFFLVPGRTIMAADVKTGPQLQVGTPHALFNVRVTFPYSRFDVSSDGRFLVSERVGRDEAFQDVVVLNWGAEMKQ